MNILTIAEYQGRRDESGRAVGHAPKVLTEYVSCVHEGMDVRIFAPKTVIRSACCIAGVKKNVSVNESKNASLWKELIREHKVRVLPHSIVMKGNISFCGRVMNKLRMFANIRAVLRNAPGDKVWFFNTEYYLMLYLALFGNGGKEIVITTFMEGFRAGKNGRFAFLKQKIFEKAQKKIKLIIATGPKFEFKNAESVFIPDYVYDPDVYEKYRRKRKDKELKKYAVCLGTMNPEKQLEEMVTAFTRVGFPLIVAGCFYDKDRLAALKEIAGDNIDIRDGYLSRDAYMELLAGAEFAVLPYSPDQYATQTSGVLQEAVFLDTVPLSYNAVLDGNAVPGVGFDSFEDLDRDMLDISGKKKKDFTAQYKRLREEVYDRSLVENKLRKCFASADDGEK
ncbi:MAG: hypothetical protein BWY61_00568 [Firmicutes bacterium ADurb.Bin354]|nr:MAG: hypothetical protein BWY61_00568 [Firmicutes bacterium ADurb.Bin354]